MTEITIEDAQAKLAELVDSLGDGDEVILTRNHQPVAKLVGQSPAVAPSREPRKPGSARGTVIYMADDFDVPLDDFKDYMP